MQPHVEFVGWTVNRGAREYTLRVRETSGEFRQITVAIPIEAFSSRRARFQDGPEISFLKLTHELAASTGTPPAAHLEVTNEDLAAYQVTHGAKVPQRRPKVLPAH
jgi:hypothetical protein